MQIDSQRSSLLYASMDSKISQLSVSNQHIVHVHCSGQLSVLGWNNSHGQLGKGDCRERLYYFEEGGDVTYHDMPFDSNTTPWNEVERREMKMRVFTGPQSTVVLVGCEREERKSDELFWMISFEGDILRVFHPVVQKISPDLDKVLCNEALINGLSPRERELLCGLVRTMCEIVPTFNTQPFDNIYYHIEKFSMNYKDRECIGILFLLNDISDCGLNIKEYLLDRLILHLNEQVVLDWLELVSQYLSRHVLKNSKHSILMVFAKKCMAFVKQSFSLHRDKFENDERYIKLEPKIQEAKPLDSIKITWKEETITSCESFSHAMKLLLEEGSTCDCKMMIGKNELVFAHKFVLSSCSPVLKVLFETENFKTSEDGATYDMYEFVRSDQDGAVEVELKYSALRSLIYLCYGKLHDTFTAKDVIQMMNIAHQLQMDIPQSILFKLITKCVSMESIVELMNESNIENNLLMHQYLITYCLKTLSHQQLKTLRLKDIPKSFKFELEKYEMALYKKQVPAWMECRQYDLGVSESDMLQAVFYHATHTKEEQIEEYDFSE